MTAKRLLDDLRRLGVELSQRDGKLLCNAPRGVLTDELRGQISQSKPDLLRLLQSEAIGADSPEAIPIVSRDEPLPLSFSQERIWKLGKIEPRRNETGNIPFEFRIAGPLDTRALEQTIQEIVRRHEVFRSSCKVVDNKPTLSISPFVSLNFPVHDLQHLSSAALESEIRRKTLDLALMPFDLENPPMLRVTLLHIEPARYVFLLVTHVFAFDGSSTPILLRELSSLYEDFLRGASSPLPPLPLGYADFSSWHRKWLRGDRLAKQKAYWKTTLQGTSLVTAPVNTPDLSSATLPITFPDFLTEPIRAVSRESGVTLFVTLMSVLQTLLQRYSLNQSIAVGTIVSNRRGQATESMIGSFANNILLRADFPPGSTFRSVLLHARNAALSTFSNQDLPFESLLGELEAPLVHAPLFRVMFVFHQHGSMDRNGLRFDSLAVDMHPVDKRQSNYLLDLVLTDVDGKLSGILEYNTTLFTREEAQSFIQRYLVIVKNVSTNPDGLIEKLPTFPDNVFDRREQTSVHKSITTSSHKGMTAVELALEEIWKRLLRIDVLDKNDDFFDLGGHSLLALALIEEVESKFGVPNLLEAFAKRHTIASVAEAIERSTRA